MITPMFKVKIENNTPEYAEFIIEPLEPGYGHTVGNALRRVLLTSIQGAAVTTVKISGVKHRFSTVPGLKENVVDLLLNLKGVHFKLSEAKESATVRIVVKGQQDITAADIEETDGVEVINKDHYLGSYADKKGKFEAELTIERGYGYALTDERKVTTLGVISTDAIFTPVIRVNYSVEATRVGRQTNLDKLILHVWTNGTITPEEALQKASRTLTSYFAQIFEPQESLATVTTEGTVRTAAIPEELLKMTIDELDLPTRIYNSLRNGGIETIGHLLGVSRKDLMTMRNMGGKSIGIIEDKLKEKGITLTV